MSSVITEGISPSLTPANIFWFSLGKDVVEHWVADASDGTTTALFFPVVGDSDIQTIQWVTDSVMDPLKRIAADNGLNSDLAGRGMGGLNDQLAQWLSTAGVVPTDQLKLPDPNATPAGWYPDPEGISTHRYWDGSLWTEHRA